MTEKTKQKEVKLLQPKIDIVFQSLFNAKNKEITKSFVEALLEEKIDSMIINNEKEITRDKPIDKLGILDLELDINNKEKVDVEVQLLKMMNSYVDYYFIGQGFIQNKYIEATNILKHEE